MKNHNRFSITTEKKETKTYSAKIDETGGTIKVIIEISEREKGFFVRKEDTLLGITSAFDSAMNFAIEDLELTQSRHENTYNTCDKASDTND